MGSIKIKNNAKSTLAADITSTDTSLTLPTGEASKFPALGDGDYFYATIADANNPDANEIVKVVKIIGDTFTIERAQEGTTAQDWSAGALVEQRITAQTFADSVDVFQDPPNRIYLDEILIARENTPRFSSAIIMANANKKFAAKLMQDWDTYWGPRLKCASVNITDGKYEDELQFPTIEDMYAYLTNNVPASGSNDAATVYIKPYETIDNSIPTPTKIYPLNRFFSAIRGRRRYRTTTISAEFCHDALSSILTDLFNQMTGASTGSAEVIDVKRTIWLPTSKNNFYGGFHPSMSTHTYDTNGYHRRVYVGSNTFDNVAVGEYFNIDFTSIKYFGLSDNGSTLISYPYTVKPNLLGKRLINDGYSFVVAALFKSISDPNRQIVVVKPVGVDSFVVEMPDFTNYDFEIVAFNNDKQSMVDVLPITTQADLSIDYDERFGKMRFKLFDIKKIIHTHDGRTTRSAHRPNSIRFRLRRKSDKKVSNFSPVMIAPVFKNKLLAFNLLPISD